MPICSKCDEEKPINNFSKSARNKDGYLNQCKSCINIINKKWYKKKGGYSYIAGHRGYLNARLKYKYGITIDDYDELLKLQRNVCAICGKKEKQKRPLGVDHNHKTKRVRGLLCHKCNVLLGLCGEDTDILVSAISYLKKEN